MELIYYSVGFSKQVIALLNSHNAKYETFDILEDWDVREGKYKLNFF